MSVFQGSLILFKLYNLPSAEAANMRKGTLSQYNYTKSEHSKSVLMLRLVNRGATVICQYIKYYYSDTFAYIEGRTEDSWTSTENYRRTRLQREFTVHVIATKRHGRCEESIAICNTCTRCYTVTPNLSRRLQDMSSSALFFITLYCSALLISSRIALLE